MTEALHKKHTDTMNKIETDNPCNHCIYANDYYGHCLLCVIFDDE